MIDLSRRLALVTGGSRGIGTACVRALARAGGGVAFSYREQGEAARGLTGEMEEEGRKVFAIQAELGDRDACEDLVRESVSHLGGLDILVHSAGIWTGGAIEAMPDEVWAETMRVNLDSAFYLTRAAVPHLRGKEHGRIIYISSTAAQRGEAGHSHYAASKGAVQSFTKSLAVELASDEITVNAVAPGWVRTEMVTAPLSEAELESAVAGIPRGRMADPEDIAGPVLFLASDLAAHVTGEILNVNGGAVLCG
ncbi:MAG: 3-oxoacyl-ACP reductase family protein [bacterium]